MATPQWNRRAFLATAGIGVAGAFSLNALTEMDVAGAAAPAQEGLQRLLAGNLRFAEGKPACGPATARRIELANGQAPFAIVLGCSDSRVPIETVFDQEPGEIFAVRVAGNFVNNDGLGSIEYSVAVLKSSLILVLGHSDCGAVKAAVGFVRNGTSAPGHIQELVEAIAPAARQTKGEPGSWVENAVLENVKLNARALVVRSKIIADAVTAGTVSIAGGVYNLHTGRVTLTAS
ncbi:MAG: carbonic anhydrase [Vulcanimicrobiaceae bacterium]